MARGDAAACTRVFIEIDGGEPLAVKWYGTPTAAEISTSVRRVAGLRDDAPLDVRDEDGDRVVLTHALPTGMRLFIHRDSSAEPTLRHAAPLSAHSTDSRGQAHLSKPAVVTLAAAVVGLAAICVALRIGWLPDTLDTFHRKELATHTMLTSADPRDEPAIAKEIVAPLPQKCTSEMTADEQRTCAFESVARNGAWMLGGEQSLSGPGSSLSATKAAREWLDAIVKDYDIMHILDIGCGDGYWQGEIQSLAAQDGHVVYVGLDISTIALKKAREHNANNPYMKWAVADMAAEDTAGLEDLLQRHIATQNQAKRRTSKPLLDLVVVRDAFQHMKHDDVRRALRNLKRVGFRWLAASSLQYSTENRQMDEEVYLKGQGYYDANLQIPPFSLAPARRLMHDRKYGADSQHPMAVWERRRYGEGGPPKTHPSEKYFGLWHFDDVPAFEH